jgi:hypothetical protein
LQARDAQNAEGSICVVGAGVPKFEIESIAGGMVESVAIPARIGESMTTAILVGAGASLAEALPSRPPRDRCPPLDATFFELCRLAKLEGREALRSYMDHAFGMDPFSDGYRMEEIFNFVYTEAFSDNVSDSCLAAYWGLIRMYAAAIGRTTNPLGGTSRYGVGGLVRALLQQDPDDEYIFVTFNQDLVIEKAIEAVATTARYSYVPWNLRTAYGVNFSHYLRVASRPKSATTGSTAPSVQILKLHGSLNWFYNVRSVTDPKNSIRSPSGELHCVTNPQDPDQPQVHRWCAEGGYHSAGGSTDLRKGVATTVSGRPNFVHREASISASP